VSGAGRRKLAGWWAVASGLRRHAQQTLDDLDSDAPNSRTARISAVAPCGCTRRWPGLPPQGHRTRAALRDRRTGGLSPSAGLIDQVTLTPADNHFAIELEGWRMLALANSSNMRHAVSEVFGVR
jgi:hypothetical protein